MAEYVSIPHKFDPESYVFMVGVLNPPNVTKSLNEGFPFMLTYHSLMFPTSWHPLTEPKI